MTDITAILNTGDVEYSMEEASVDIKELIDALIEAEEDGATHIVLESGNYRGPKYIKLYTSVSFDED